MSWSKEEARALAQTILGHSRADECEVQLNLEQSSHTRFAANDVTTAGSARDLVISITSRGGGRSGSVRVTDADPEALKRAVARSEEIMAVAPEDPEWVEGLGPQTYPDLPAFDEGTAKAGALERRDGVKAALDAGRGGKLDASGFFETSAAWSCIANKKGNFGFFPATTAGYSATLRTADGTGSGWAGFASPRLSDIRPGDLVARARRKAETSTRPRDLEPGRYTVILEPQAVADLFSNFGFALSLRTADEGRSFLSKPGGGSRIGEALVHESVTIRSDPFDPRIPGRPWTLDGGGGGFLGRRAVAVPGLPARRTTWVENGVLKALPVDRYWAKKTGKEPLPYSGSLVIEGGSGTVEDLVAGTERGLLVTRFWYIRVVNPQSFQLTGLTRDGVWLVEKGKVVGPVNNFRFNDGPLGLLKNAEALSASVSTGTMVVPAIRSTGFNFSSRSDAV